MEGLWLDPETGELVTLIDRQEQLALFYEYVDTLSATEALRTAHTAAGEHLRQTGHRLEYGCCKPA